MSIMKPERERVMERMLDVTSQTPASNIPLVELYGDRYYKIENSEELAPFFMSLVSSSDHWFYVASNGGLSIGRRNANSAMFPYDPADKIIEMAGCTGPRTCVQLKDQSRVINWIPFSREGSSSRDGRTESVYLNESNSSVMFEEWNRDLNLRFRYRWNTSGRFGFVRRCELINESPTHHEIRILDGMQNILPPGLEYRFQQRFSNLGDAYKKSEFVALEEGEAAGLALFFLNSVPSDRAEPSEGLRATTVFQLGLSASRHLLCNSQLANVPQGWGDQLRAGSSRAAWGLFL